MRRRPVLALAVTALLAVLASYAAASVAAPRDRKAPRMVAATMVDGDGDHRADRVRLAYSERVRHARDADGTYPLRVTGYRVKAVGASSGKVVVVLLEEKGVADADAKPAVGYRRTSSKPVRDAAGNQAAAQVFRGTGAHGNVEPPPPPPPDKDPDRDGYATPADCAPNDAAVHPGAADKPDVSFADTNCDGIDGNELMSIFASPAGNDSNPGTKERPKREIQAAVQAAGTGRDVLVAAGSYGPVRLDVASADVGIYGSYEATSWARRLASPATTVTGTPEGVLAVHVTGVTLQLLTIRGTSSAAERTAYGIRALDGSSLALEKVVVTAADGTPGVAGVNGRLGANGGNGGGGGKGLCYGVYPGGGGGYGRHGGRQLDRPRRRHRRRGRPLGRVRGQARRRGAGRDARRPRRRGRRPGQGRQGRHRRRAGRERGERLERRQHDDGGDHRLGGRERRQRALRLLRPGWRRRRRRRRPGLRALRRRARQRRWRRRSGRRRRDGRQRRHLRRRLLRRLPSGLEALRGLELDHGRERRSRRPRRQQRRGRDRRHRRPGQQVLHVGHRRRR